MCTICTTRKNFRSRDISIFTNHSIKNKKKLSTPNQQLQFLLLLTVVKSKKYLFSKPLLDIYLNLSACSNPQT